MILPSGWVMTSCGYPDESRDRASLVPEAAVEATVALEPRDEKLRGAVGSHEHLPARGDLESDVPGSGCLAAAEDHPPALAEIAIDSPVAPVANESNARIHAGLADDPTDDGPSPLQADCARLVVAPEEVGHPTAVAGEAAVELPRRGSRGFGCGSKRAHDRDRD